MHLLKKQNIFENFRKSISLIFSPIRYRIYQSPFGITEIPKKYKEEAPRTLKCKEEPRENQCSIKKKLKNLLEC